MFDITSDKQNFCLIIILLVTLEAAALSSGKLAFNKIPPFPPTLSEQLQLMKHYFQTVDPSKKKLNREEMSDVVDSMFLMGWSLPGPG